MNKKIKRLSLVFSVVFMVSIIVGTQFLATVSAKKPTVTYNPVKKYTFIVGKLDGADYGLFIPDDWNGMLVVLCRGYRHTLGATFPGSFSMGVIIGRYFMNASLIPMPPLPPGPKFAFAWSNYGKGGYCVKAGMIRTHQLTKYIVGKYSVPGKVFLMSLSMGGTVACVLGEKYPNLYSGVLDMVGVKNLTASHAHKAALASQTSAMGVRNYFAGPPANIPLGATEDINATNFQDYVDGQAITQADMEIECGGSPAEKPKAYERRSPVNNPEVSIPIIIVHGTHDRSVPYTQSIEYRDRVNAATEPDLCELNLVPGAGHVSPLVVGLGLMKFHQLVAWSNILDP